MERSGERHSVLRNSGHSRLNHQIQKVDGRVGRLWYKFGKPHGKGGWRASHLRDTLTSCPQLGQLVRRLVLHIFDHEYEATLNHIKILQQCPNLEDLKIYGYNGYLLDSYRATVESLHKLRSLNISWLALTDREYYTDHFFQGGELLAVLLRTPQIEQVCVPYVVDDVQLETLNWYCKEKGIQLSRFE